MYERAIFKPVDPTRDSESWPQLSLTDVIVYTSKPGSPITYVDLLDVQTTGPVRVRGNLARVPAKYKNIYKSRGRNRGPPATLYTQPLVLTQVTTYSIEGFVDGGIRIWALGSGAWFSLDPAPDFKPIFRVMLQKSHAWNTFQDVSDGPGGSGATLDGLYEMFDATQATEIPNDQVDDIARFYDEHRKFFLTKMFEPSPMLGAEGRREFQWENSALYHHYVDLCPDLVEEIRAGFEKTNEQADTPNANSVAQDIARDVPESEDDSTEFPRVQDISKVGSTSHRPRARSGVGRSGDSAGKGRPAEPKTPKRGGPSRRSNFVDEEGGEIDGFSSSSDEGAPTHTRSSKGKSVLRPARPRNDIPIDRSSPLEVQDDGPTTITVDKLIAPGAAPGISTRDRLKRKGIDDIPHTYNGENRFIKRLRSTNQSVSSSSGDPSADEAVKVNWPELKPGRGRPPVIVSRLLATSSNRAGGHWICTIDNCGHEILDAGTRSGRRAIEEHYQTHEKIVKEAMAVINVETHPSNGVHKIDNLLAKIEDMAQRWASSRPQPLQGLGP